MLEKEVQLLVVSVIGVVAILTVFTKQTDLSQVCVAGLIGFLGAKASGISDAVESNSGYEVTLKNNNTKNETERKVITKEEIEGIVEEIQNKDEMA